MYDLINFFVIVIYVLNFFYCGDVVGCIVNWKFDNLGSKLENCWIYNLCVGWYIFDNIFI